MKFVNRTFEGDIPPRLTKWLYCSSGMFRDGVYQFVSMFLLTFVQFFALGFAKDAAEYGMYFGVITIIVVILRIWDGVNDPIMGWLIEKCKFKWGKYRPWILIGALSNSIVTILMFWILPEGWAYVATFAVWYFLWDFTYTMNDIAYWSVLPSLSSKEKIRANLTTTLSIFISVGTFAVGGIVPLLAAGNVGLVYQIIAIVTSVLFFASQLILVIFMKERKIDDNVAKTDEKMKLRDIFTVIIKNNQLRVSIIAMLIYYIGSGFLVAAGLNYFYFTYGYKEGGSLQFIFTVVFAVATFAGQFLYPLLKNKLKWSNMKIFTICSLSTICSYILLFAYVFIPDPKTYFPLLCVFAFFAFIGQTIMSLVLYIMIQDTIDYNEYKHKERREAATFSLRAFSAKMASSIQQGLLYLFLTISSLYVIQQQIASVERDFNVNGGEAILGADYVFNAVEPTIAGIEHWQLIVFHIGFTIVPMLMFVISFLLIKFKYKINENNHESMIKAINARYKGEEYRDEYLDDLDQKTSKTPKNKKRSIYGKNPQSIEAFRNTFKEILNEVHNPSSKEE